MLFVNRVIILKAGTNYTISSVFAEYCRSLYHLISKANFKSHDIQRDLSFSSGSYFIVGGGKPFYVYVFVVRGFF